MKKSISVLLLVVLLAIIGTISMIGRQSENPPQGGDGDAFAIVARAADRETPDPEREARRKRSIDLAAQKWYEELLEKYPEMRPVYRDVPDERNGYLQFLLLAEGLKAPLLPDDLGNMISGASGEWDSGKFEAWVAQNRTFFDELLRIAELPERSAKGVAMDRVFGAPARHGSTFGHILSASARAAFEKGDQETALRYLKASTAIGDHVVDTEVPTMLSEVISVGIRTSARELFCKDFLPVLANDPEVLNRWSEAVFRKEEPSAEYARVIHGEWNACMRSFMLPALLGDSSSDMAGAMEDVRDVEGLIESYTRILKNTAAGVRHSGSDGFDVREATAAFPDAVVPVDHVKAGSRKITAEGMLMSLRTLPEALGKGVTRNAMASAAVSILRGEEPPVDPVSGEAFLWDAETRTLRAPGGGEDSEPIVVP